ncbi:MAG: MBOAT family O-acyltransferase [Candidatus Shapirobacteria bacterium]|jgi:D-alanyl-lipoteichoic acid acyltransferase DltB (MBOAT superfamily)
MDITSLHYFVFLAIFVFVYYLAPPRLRLIPILLGSSLFIITQDVGLFLFLLFFISLNYLLLILLNHSQNPIYRRAFLFLSVSLNLLVLIFFKYLTFITDNLNRLFSGYHPSLSMSAVYQLVAPLGVSFFVFKMLSLIIDTYRTRQKSLTLALLFSYILFFPEFLSGPINRFQNFFGSLQSQSKFVITNFYPGVYRFLLGLFKKLIVANSFAALANPVFDNPASYSSFHLLIATYLFSFQIFFDFSGYSDMAIGVGKILGFTIPENFNSPYLSTSIKEFWRRWHITLSSWFRDYLYIPLGGNRHGLIRQIFNVLFVFLLTGFWHGASWNFIVWGIIHGVYQVAYMLLHPLAFITKINPRLKSVLGIFLTFHLVNFSWIFFRAKSLNQALSFTYHLVSPHLAIRYLDLTSLYEPLILLLVLYFLLITSKYKPNSSYVKVAIAGFVFLSILFNPTSEPQDFLYFKF